MITFFRVAVVCVFTVFFSTVSFSDSKFDGLISSGKYEDAINYADISIPPANRDAGVWVKLGLANERTGLREKGLACYIFALRLSPNNYDALLGAAKIYNNLEQPNRAINYAKKATEQSMTAEAAWEYARACIALKRASEAKDALAKILETKPNNVIANRELGVILFNEKKYEQAIPLLKIALSNKKEFGTTYKIASSYLETGDLENAIVFLENALKLKPNAHKVRLKLARLYYKTSKMEKASVEFDKVLPKVKSKASDYYMLALAKEQNGNNKGAITAYRKAVLKYGQSKSKEAIIARGKIGFYDLNRKRYAQALPNLKFVYSVDNKGDIVQGIHFALAEAYIGTKKLLSAISVFEHAIKVDGKNLKAYTALANLYEKKNMKTKARKTYEAMLSLDPNDPKIFLILGLYNLKKKNYDKALDLLEKSNSLKSSSEALEGIAKTAMALNLKSLAKEASAKAININPKVLESRIILYKLCMEEKDYSGAAEQLEVILKKRSKNLKYSKDLAKCYQNTGDQDKLALADARVIKLDSKNTESRLRYAEYNAQKGNNTLAFNVYRKLTILMPRNAEVFRGAVDALKKLKRKKNAITYLEKYLVLRPKDAEAYRELGDLCYEVKYKTKALNAYRKTVKLNSSLGGFYRRYAELLSTSASDAEVVRILTKIIESGKADAEVYLQVGRIHKKNKRYKKAINFLEEASRLFPNNSSLVSEIASCYYNKGDINNAVIYYEQVVMLNPKAKSEYKILGNLYSRQKKNKQAMKMYKKYLDNSSGNSSIAKKVGTYAYKTGDYDGAVKYLSMTKGKTAKQFTVNYMLADASFNSGKYNKAIEIANKLIKRQPKISMKKTLYKMLAVSYEKLGKNKKAANAYSIYISFSGVKDNDASFKAAYLQEKSNPKKAEIIYNKNIKSYPKDYRNFYQLAKIYQKRKATRKKAVLMFKKTAKLVDTIPSVWIEMARIYKKLGNKKAELESYNAYLDKEPQNVEANKNVGILLVDDGKYNKGIIHLEMANTMSPKDSEVIMALAMAYKKTNRTKNAIDMLEKARAIKRDDPDLLIKLAQLYLEQNMSKESGRVIKALMKLRVDNKYLTKCAELLIASGNYKDAERAIEDIRLSDPENIEILMLLAKIQRAQKKYDKAIGTYKEISDIDRNYVPALYERAEVFFLKKDVMWAELFYKRTLKRNPKYALAELGLAKVAKVRRNHTSYMMHLKLAKKLDPTNKLILKELSKAK